MIAKYSGLAIKLCNNMALYAINPQTGRKRKVAEYDLSLMLTLSDVLPSNPALAKQFLVKKKDAPAGRLRDIYHTKDNTRLIRKIFTVCLKAILFEMAMGRCQFIWPIQGRSSAKLIVGSLPDKLVKTKRQYGDLKYLKMFQSDHKVPYIEYRPSKNSKQYWNVYVDKTIYSTMIKHANSGKPFSKLPRELDYFLPYIYEEFSYIKEDKLKALLRYCFLQLQMHLKRGEEVRILDGTSEIRFFRPLGKKHDSVMRKVARKRFFRERKQNKNAKAVS